ncbi:MAG: hypothetical protein JNM10_12835 [Planctomycetia bacterium]|nr:hypothetical protein [Planctomycetia bacterium]
MNGPVVAPLALAAPPLAAALGLAAPLLAALALVRALAPTTRDRATLVLRAATVALATTGIASLLAVAKGVTGTPLAAGALEAVVVVASLAVLAIGTRPLRPRTGLASPAPDLPPPAPMPPMGAPLAAPPRAGRATVVARVALAVGVIAALVAVVARARKLPDGDWDAICFWTFRARLLAAAPADPAAIFTHHLPDTHPDYPLLLPGAIAWIEAHTGVTRHTGLALGLLFHAALVAAVGGTVAALRRAPAAAIAALAVLTLPRFLRLAPSWTADLPVAAMFATAVGWLALASETASPSRDREARRLAGLALGLALWTKNEGCAQFVAGALTVVVLRSPTLSRARSLLALVVGAAPFLVAYAVQHALWAPPNDLVAGQGPSTLARLTDPARWTLLLREMASHLVSTKSWGFAFPVALLALAAASIGPLARRMPFLPPAGDGATGAAPRVAHRPVTLCVVLVLAAYATVYAITPQPLAWHLDTSCERILAHVVPSVLLAVVLRLSPPRHCAS